MKQFFQRNKISLKWIGLAFAIKIPLFLFFAYNFQQYWPQRLVTNNIFIAAGDTWGYYDPCEAFVKGRGYNSYCRMPGLLPIYALLRLIFDKIWTKTIIIILQFIVSTLSVYVLARIAKMLFKTDRSFKITFFLYAVSSFVSIWDHFGYADSFGVSMMIFSIYFLLKSKTKNKTLPLLLSGLFITWSIFFRPVHGILIPLLILIYIIDLKLILTSLKNITLFCLPFTICIGFWINHNYKLSNRIIVLQGPTTECFPGITEEMVAIRELITAWGGDIQPWAKGSAGKWFFRPQILSKGENLNEGNVMTLSYNQDSLVKLRTMFHELNKPQESVAKKDSIRAKLIFTVQEYKNSYVKEHPFNYYFSNRVRVLKNLLIRDRLDDMPFPNLSKMSFIQKIVKGGYFVLLLAINLLGMLACLIALFKKNKLALVPLVFIFLFSFILGYLEQRYLGPVYALNILFIAYLLDDLATKYFLQKKEKNN